MGYSNRGVRRNGSICLASRDGVDATNRRGSISLDTLPGTAESEEIHHLDAGCVNHRVLPGSMLTLYRLGDLVCVDLHTRRCCQHHCDNDPGSSECELPGVRGKTMAHNPHNYRHAYC